MTGGNDDDYEGDKVTITKEIYKQRTKDIANKSNQSVDNTTRYT